MGDAQRSYRRFESVISAKERYAPVCLVGLTKRPAELEPGARLSLSQVIKQVRKQLIRLAVVAPA